MNPSTLIFLCLFGVAILNQGRCKPSEDTDDYPQDGEGEDNYDEEEDTDAGPPPKMISKSQTFLVDLKGNVTLPCEAEGNPTKFSRVWRKGEEGGLFVGNLKQTSDPRLNHNLKSGALEIQNIRLNDEGNYTCLISDSEKVVYSVEFKEPAKITEIYPNEYNVLLKEHFSLTLTCIAGIGKPTPEVKWFKDGHALDRVKEDATLNAATYTIVNASAEDSGTYKCTAHNSVQAEPDHKNVYIQVTYPPQVKIAEGEDVVVTGVDYETSIRCIVTGPKKLQVKWYKDGVPIEVPSKTVKFAKNENNHFLIIRSIKTEDFGSYKCVAKSSEGESSAVIQLTGKPKPVYKEYKTDKETNDPVLIFNTTSYAPIEEYELLYKRQEENEWESLRPSPTVSNPEEGTSNYVLEQVITGLEPGVYVAQLKAKNEYGWSEYPSLAEFPKAAGSSSAELRISLAMFISLLIARFYC